MIYMRCFDYTCLKQQLNKGKEAVSLQLAKSKFSQDETKVNWNTKARYEEGTSGSIR